MTKKDLILIKLGGSVITDKSTPQTLRQQILNNLIAEISDYRTQNPDTLLIVGHGQGSFAHIPAKKYQTKLGFINNDSKYGMAVTQLWAGQTHQLVLKAMIEQQLPAVSFRVASTGLNSKSSYEIFTESLFANLDNGLLPVTCGDVVADSEKGCTIWSTELVLEKITQAVIERTGKTERKSHRSRDNQGKQQKHPVLRIIHVTDVDGVLDSSQKLIKEITSRNLAKIKPAILGCSNTDVTGGMWHKVDSCINMTKVGVESAIISGLIPKNLYNCLSQREFVGTVVK